MKALMKAYEKFLKDTGYKNSPNYQTKKSITQDITMATQPAGEQEAVTAQIAKARDFALRGRIDSPQAGIDFEPAFVNHVGNAYIIEETRTTWAEFSGGNSVTLVRRNHEGGISCLTFTIEELEGVVEAAKQARINLATKNVADMAVITQQRIDELNALSPSPAKKRRH